MNTHLLMHNYDIGGGRHIRMNSNIHAVADIMANNIINGMYLEISQTSTVTNDISAANIYTKTQVDTLLTRKANPSDITLAIKKKTDKSTTYTKSDVDNL